MKTLKNICAALLAWLIMQLQLIAAPDQAINNDAKVREQINFGNTQFSLCERISHNGKILYVGDIENGKIYWLAYVDFSEVRSTFTISNDGKMYILLCNPMSQASFVIGMFSLYLVDLHAGKNIRSSKVLNGANPKNLIYSDLKSKVASFAWASRDVKVNSIVRDISISLQDKNSVLAIEINKKDIESRASEVLFFDLKKKKLLEKKLLKPKVNKTSE